MADIEKVVEGLKKVWNAFDSMEHELYADYVFDALELLKELNQRIWDLCCENESLQDDVMLKEEEAVEPSPAYFHEFKAADLYHCGICNELIVKDQKYCHVCGRKVKWDG